MNAFPVKVVSMADAASGNAKPLLHELAELLDRWVKSGETAAIDLASLPLTGGDYEELRAALGAGAVSAAAEAIGKTEVCETQFPGLWWVTHYNESGGVVANLLEVCDVPAILKAPAEDAAEGLIRLREALQS